jgi:hypothetical protein
MGSVPTREEASSVSALPKPGLYRHFKGGEYEVLEVARHSETEELLVIYCSVEDPATTWVRPLEMFTGMVERPDGSLPRFELTALTMRRSGGPLSRLLRAVLSLLEGRQATATAGATRRPLERADRVLRRPQTRAQLHRSRSGHTG